MAKREQTIERLHLGSDGKWTIHLSDGTKTVATEAEWNVCKALSCELYDRFVMGGWESQDSLRVILEQLLKLRDAGRAAQAPPTQELDEAYKAAKDAGYGSGSLSSVIENLVEMAASAKRSRDHLISTMDRLIRENCTGPNPDWEDGFSEAIRLIVNSLASSPVQRETPDGWEIVRDEWEYEDELPKGYPYHEMWPKSMVPNGVGVRVFPKLRKVRSVASSTPEQEGK